MGENNGPLSALRVLDLSDEKGCLCGKIMADLGADVIKIEPPGGDRTRRKGPFYKNQPDPEKSLLWFVYNAGKRGITLDIDTADGRALLLRLVASADFLIESFKPGAMTEMGLGYDTLEKINPRLIMASISPWGQTGPYKDYAASDLVVSAMGGQINTMGYAGKHPIRLGVPQAWVNASAHAAAGMMIAHYFRKKTGRGQQVDVAAQNVMAQTTGNAIPNWQTAGRLLTRAGERRSGLSANADLRQFYRCRDGFVMFSIVGGTGGMRNNQAMVDWMAEAGMADDYLKAINWQTFDKASVDQETIDRIEAQVSAFLMQHDKKELYEEGGRRHIMLYPVQTPGEMRQSRQLAARNFWVDIHHDELDDTITYPGAFAIGSKNLCRVAGRAPLIGEHNEEIFEKELGLDRKEILALKQGGII